jgi:hypothetical protein
MITVLWLIMHSKRKVARNAEREGVIMSFNEKNKSCMGKN